MSGEGPGPLAMLGEETGWICRICGCTDDNGCVDGNGKVCWWEEEDLCSACSNAHGEACWMGPRQWIDLREALKEERARVIRGRELLDLRDDERVRVASLDWVLQAMDETLI